MADSLRVDPWGSHDFCLEVEGLPVVEVARVEGLQAQAQPFHIVEGGRAHAPHVRVGVTEWPHLVITCFEARGAALRRWFEEVVAHPFAPEAWRGGAVGLLDLEGRVVRRYHFDRALPVAWRGPTLEADRSGLALEVVELCHEGLLVRDS